MDSISRKDALKSLIVLPAMAALGISMTQTAEAEGTNQDKPKATKARYKYQDKPKGEQSCGNCKFFLPGKQFTGPGKCQVIAGTISFRGWCYAWMTSNQRP